MHGIWKTSPWKTVHRATVVQFKETCSFQHKERPGKPSVALSQIRGFMRLFNAAQGNPHIPSAENCKFPIKLCRRFSTVG
jgi:hypothetical protein